MVEKTVLMKLVVAYRREPKYNRELKINDAATPRRGVNMYDKKKVFWNLMSVTTV